MDRSPNVPPTRAHTQSRLTRHSKHAAICTRERGNVRAWAGGAGVAHPLLVGGGRQLGPVGGRPCDAALALRRARLDLDCFWHWQTVPHHRDYGVIGAAAAAAARGNRSSP